MSSFPGSPRLIKGAIVSIQLPSPIPQIIIFQYNPDTLTRSLSSRGATAKNNDGDKAETSRIRGTPIENISLEIELDATDQLEHPDQNKITTLMGIYPQLASLEMILYPKLTGILLNAALNAAGVTQITPMETPFTLFIHGQKRVLPVKLTELRITEQAHDTSLNPIRAKISLGLQVLSYSDFKMSHPGYYVFMAHHALKEAMSIVGTVSGLGSISGSISGSASISI